MERASRSIRREEAAAPGATAPKASWPASALACRRMIESVVGITNVSPFDCRTCHVIHAYAAPTRH